MEPKPTTTKRGSEMKTEKPKSKESMEPILAPMALVDETTSCLCVYGTNTGTDDNGKQRMKVMANENQELRSLWKQRWHRRRD